MKYLMMIVVALMLVSCTDENAAMNALTSQGFTEIQLGGYSFFGCSQDDTFATKFIARNPQGIMVNGVVCSAFLKGATIRF